MTRCVTALFDSIRGARDDEDTARMKAIASHLARPKSNSSRRLALTAVAAMLSAHCGLWPTGPSKSVAGNWRAPGIGHSGNYYELSLTQDGDAISGVACGSDSGFLLFADGLVSGDYPKVVFTDRRGATFSGKFEEDRDQIAGEYGASRIPLRFTRSDSGRCAGAKPIP